MLRSFQLAATTALRNERADDIQRLAPWAKAWTDAACEAYRSAYLEAAKGAIFLPALPADTDLLLDVYQLDKALYEIGYDLSYRPNWVSAPLRFVNDMVAQIGARGK